LTDTDKQNSTGKYTNQMQLKKQTTQNTEKQKHPGSVACYDTSLNEMVLFYDAPEPTRGHNRAMAISGLTDHKSSKLHDRHGSFNHQ